MFAESRDSDLNQPISSFSKIEKMNVYEHVKGSFFLAADFPSQSRSKSALENGRSLAECAFVGDAPCERVASESISNLCLVQAKCACWGHCGSGS